MWRWPRLCVDCPQRTGCAGGSTCLLSGVHLLDHSATVAYCLPGLRPRIVVSSGALQTPDPDELAAVLAHERAYARGHHDLVVQPFVAWKQTFPFLPTAAAALATVDLLVEMLADDAARQRRPARHLRAALSRMSGTRPDDRYLQTQITARRAASESRPDRSAARSGCSSTWPPRPWSSPYLPSCSSVDQPAPTLTAEPLDRLRLLSRVY